MRKDALAIMGIPIDNFSLEEFVEKTFALIERFPQERIPHYISTVNADFLTYCYQWNAPGVYYAELVENLRSSSLASADGVSLLVLSKLLGQSLKRRTTGADLFERLAEECSKREKTIFFLGGERESAQKAASVFTAKYPGLKIVGIATPQIAFQGSLLAYAEETDDLLVEEINRASPDLLAINLGNPKQELWFQRVRGRLKAPVSIGIGGAFNFFSKKIKRAPPWMRDNGLEWAFRIKEEPQRLGKRYAKDFVKLAYMATPLIFYHWFNSFVSVLFYGRYKNFSLPFRHPLLFLSARHGAAVVALPPYIEASFVDDLYKTFEEAFEQDVVIADFGQTLHFDLSGVNFFIQIEKRAQKKGKPLLLFGLSSSLERLLKYHRVWDVFSPYLQRTAEGLLGRISAYLPSSRLLYEAINQEFETIHLSFLGYLRHIDGSSNYLLKLEPLLRNKHCLVQLRYCAEIESKGFAFLLKLKDFQDAQKRNLRLTGLNSSLKNAFRIANLDKTFDVV